jgi:hypothetical protein
LNRRVEFKFFGEIELWQDEELKMKNKEQGIWKFDCCANS